MNETIKTQLSRRTIRNYTGEPIPQDMLDAIIDAGMRTASSRGFQTASVIRVTDQSKRDQMSVINEQAYVAKATEYFLFIVDAHRHASLLREAGISVDGAASMEVFTEGFTDAVLMAQTMATAAESFGLGTNFYGNVLNDPGAVVELFDLPLLTFPILGLGMGFPAEQPTLKPRMDRSIRLMENGYVDQENFHEALADYDEEISTFVDLRFPDKTVGPHTADVVRRLDHVRPKRAAILDDIRAQGFSC